MDRKRERRNLALFASGLTLMLLISTMPTA